MTSEFESQAPEPPVTNEWDDYLMSIMSEATSRWIVHKHMTPGDQQEKLKSLLNTYHGPIDTDDADVELVRDQASDGESTDRTNDGRKSSKTMKQADL